MVQMASKNIFDYYHHDIRIFLVSNSYIFNKYMSIFILFFNERRKKTEYTHINCFAMKG